MIYATLIFTVCIKIWHLTWSVLWLIDTTVFEKVLDEHISDGVEHVPNVARVCGAGQVNKDLLEIKESLPRKLLHTFRVFLKYSTYRPLFSLLLKPGLDEFQRLLIHGLARVVRESCPDRYPGKVILKKSSEEFLIRFTFCKDLQRCLSCWEIKWYWRREKLCCSRSCWRARSTPLTRKGVIQVTEPTLIASCILFISASSEAFWQ